MGTDKQMLSKGITYLAGSIPLLFLGPVVIHNAFMNKQNVWHYLVLAVGIIICILAVYFAYRGLTIIVKSLFDD
ncbi:hypothetical protein SAMN05444396_105162 [Flavobacterium segetis]|uniref:Uncharacterized protein n=1 Tax=Flavobacterium segetis TaxID=271157 RepID=A0A1M5HKZ4_9FLAO|nr:DUF6095 family protein [Flavobacterium segetis]SHG16571.1 hypothetical protein SAMN05444396_105162 [Flavobacterium segetis]